MITINLLAPGRRRPIGPAPGVMLAFLATAAVVGLLIVVTIFLGTRLGALHRQLAHFLSRLLAVITAG